MAGNIQVTSFTFYVSIIRTVDARGAARSSLLIRITYTFDRHRLQTIPQIVCHDPRYSRSFNVDILHGSRPSRVIRFGFHTITLQRLTEPAELRTVLDSHSCIRIVLEKSTIVECPIFIDPDVSQFARQRSASVNLDDGSIQRSPICQCTTKQCSSMVPHPQQNIPIAIQAARRSHNSPVQFQGTRKRVCPLSVVGAGGTSHIVEKLYKRSLGLQQWLA